MTEQEMRDSVSIHAPVKERQFLYVCIFTHQKSFNPRSREGATLLKLEYLKTIRSFNPRSREGATLNPLTLIRFPAKCFNPRSREGAT